MTNSIIGMYDVYKDLVSSRNGINKKLRIVESALRQFEEPEIEDISRVKEVHDRIVGVPELPESRNRKALIVFILLCIFDPQSLRLFYIRNGLRKEIAGAMEVKNHCEVSHELAKIKSVLMFDEKFISIAKVVYDNLYE